MSYYQTVWKSVSFSFSLFHSVSLYKSMSLSLSVSLQMSLSLSLPVYQSMSLYVYLLVSLYLSLCVSLSVPVCVIAVLAPWNFLLPWWHLRIMLDGVMVSRHSQWSNMCIGTIAYFSNSVRITISNRVRIISIEYLINIDNHIQIVK